MKSKMIIIVTLSGWFIFLAYIFYESKEYSNSLLKHLLSLDDFVTTIFHIIIFTAPIGSTVTGYLLKERRKLLIKAQLSEKKYRDLVDNAPIGIYRTNLKGDILFANEALAKMFEFDSPAEIMQHDALIEYKNQKDGEILIERLKKMGKVKNFESETVTKRGGFKNILLSATLDKDVLSGTVMDITEWKQTKEALQKGRISKNGW